MTVTLLEKMDRAVYATGIDRLIFRKVKPRTLRWSPLLVLISLVVGYALMAANEPIAGGHMVRLNRHFLLGAVLFFGSYMLAFLVRALGPRLNGNVNHPLDERELMVRARAGAISGMILAIVTMAGCWYMGIAPVFGWWQPHSTIDWTYLGLGLLGGFFLLPSLLASWLQPRETADDED